MYILIIFWFLSTPQQTHIEFSSIETCNAARREILISHGPELPGRLFTICVKK